MNAYKLICHDIRQGVLQNKRLLIIPFFSLFACFSANLYIYDAESSAPTFADLWVALFQGCLPIMKANDGQAVIPFFWLAMFLLAAFTIFDTLHDELSGFGLQLLTRTNARPIWWFSKCIRIVAALMSIYLIVFVTSLLFALVSGYEMTMQVSSSLPERLLAATEYYQIGDVPGTEAAPLLLLAPLILFCTLGLLQMAISLFCKPVCSYIITAICVIAGTLTDSTAAFSRCGMLLTSTIFTTNGYSLRNGLIICLILMIIAVLGGMFCFQRRDLFLTKEDSSMIL